MAIIISRVKHQIINRAQSIRVPQTAKIVVNNKTINIEQLSKQHKTQETKPPKPPKPPSGGLKRQRLNNNFTKVKYQTRTPSPEFLEKINKIKNIGTNKILIIIGNGPSISEVELQKLKNLDIISINKPDPRVWPTKYWSFFDRSQLKRHEEIWETYEGTIFNSTSITKQKKGTIIFKNIGGSGFSKDMTKGLHIGRSSVFASMQIALWMNYNKIYIFGVDMNPAGIGGKLHFYGTNPDVAPELRASRFKNEAEYYSKAYNTMAKEERDKFIFCSEGINPHGFMDKYNTLKHDEAINIILSHNQ